MGLELPSELTEPLSWIGLIWPQADEEKLFEDGAKWFEFGAGLFTVQSNAQSAAQSVMSSASSGVDTTAQAFEKWWMAEDGPPQRLADDAEAALIIGGVLIVFAGLTLALKIAFIVQLITLMIEVAQAIATAFATFGATTAEVPGFIALTRGACKILIKQIVEHVQTVIKDLLEKAKNLFKLLESKVGRKGAEDVLKDLEKTGKFGPLEMKSLEADFVGEADPNNALRFFAPDTVHYMSDAERDAAKLTVRDGKLYDSGGNLLDTSAASTLHNTMPRAMYVMDGEGNMYASTTQIRGYLHHSSFLGGKDVAGAGEIEVTDGVLQRISMKSGHYRPLNVHQEQVLRVLEQQGVDISKVIREAGF